MRDSSKEAPRFDFFLFHDRNVLSGQKKKRRIGKPNKTMREIHRFFVRRVTRPKLLRGWDLNSCMMGSLPHCSPCKNLLRHARNRYFLCLDIKNAFGSVDREKLTKWLRLSLGKPITDPLGHELSFETLEGYLRSYFFVEEEMGGGLIQGAPASPDLFNLYAGHYLDRALNLLAKRYGLTYTRYLDDLLFSSPRKIGYRKRRAIRKAIREAGLAISEGKSELVDLKRAKRIEINGLGLEYGGRVYLPSKFTKHLVRKLYLVTKQLEFGPLFLDSRLLAEVNGRIGLFLSVVCLAETHTKREEKILKNIARLRALTPSSY
jgi:hypothetical protein